MPSTRENSVTKRTRTKQLNRIDLGISVPQSSISRASSGPLFCLLGVAKYLFSDNPFRGLIQVFMQGLFNLNVFGPKRLIDERLGRSEYDGCAVLARISIRLEPVAAAERSEKTPVPLIDEFEVG